MPLEVIGAGLGRTGTLTLKTAFERLGFGPCHHMTEVFGDPERQVPFWNRVADGLTHDWEEGLGRFRSCVDWPGAHFFAELAASYPQAKVILSKRDPERWYESMRETILTSMEQMGLRDEVPADHPMRFGRTLIVLDTFGNDFTKDNVIAAFERHNAAVRDRIAPDRLLEFEAADGWAPLCAFLGVDVPDEPFPKTNGREEFWAHVEKAQEVNSP